MGKSSGHTVFDLYTKGCDRKNIIVMVMMQNISSRGSGQRDISFNSIYIVVFRNPREQARIQHLARQLFPKNPKTLSEAYHGAASPPRGHFLLDRNQSKSDNYQHRTRIFLDDAQMGVYTYGKKIIASSLLLSL